MIWWEKFKRAGINFIPGKGLTLHNYDKADGIHYAGDCQIRYRTLNKTDENNPEILDKLREIFHRYEKHIGIDLQFQDFQAELANLPGDYARPKGAIILAEVVYESAASPKGSASSANFDNSRAQPKIAGCVALRPFKDSPLGKRPADSVCEMKRLYVEPDYKGLEIGKELARRIIIEAQKEGYKYMRLDTLSTMDKAQRLYESLGFYDIEPYIYNPYPDVRYMELKL